MVVGDELVAGRGDARAMGWTGRVFARTDSPIPLTSMVLPVPGEDSARLADRWEGEVVPRMGHDADNRLVIGLGSHDIDHQVSLVRARLNLANILDQATRSHMLTFVVGPPPRNDVPANQLSDLSNAYQDVAQRRGVPYVDTYHPLAQHDQWQTDMSDPGAYTPQQAGYGLLAWLVLHNGWHHWLGLTA
ncbi:GDSL-type esterase/lipase family protein [Flaviflexus equikiangi]|uniref:Lysophospholipase n=1 Tax=Flaviflexus equikiangi TaxID=2758573 RepID=A0ABS2TGJ5_9ACTO|nr:GDSL-type esterase/lipase family protein [Flaviflexus equikiangi]MBM9433503.1 lysophospholipase [Flaviflexus equikiangi]